MWLLDTNYICGSYCISISTVLDYVKKSGLYPDSNCKFLKWFFACFCFSKCFNFKWGSGIVRFAFYKDSVVKRLYGRETRLEVGRPVRGSCNCVSERGYTGWGGSKWRREKFQKVKLLIPNSSHSSET